MPGSDNEEGTGGSAGPGHDARAPGAPETDPPAPAARAPSAGAGAPGSRAWERDLLNRLAFASLVEQRRTRRWGVFFKLALLAYLFVLLALYAPLGGLIPSPGERHTALVDVQGVIAADSEASADAVVAGLRAAFEDDDTAGVILRINSPGGSPVQASYINREIRRLREQHADVPVYAVITDLCASGGYYVAVAADRIYANESSVVGSIGVLMNGFGFVDAMDKLGIERRLLTAGEHKGLLDPFSPVDPEEVSHVRALLEELHEQFIAVVREGRGDALADHPEIFSGLVWSGKRGRELGLVDAMGSAGYVAREVVGAEEIKDFTRRRDYLQQLAERFGAALGQAASRHHALTRALDSGVPELR